MDHKSGENCLMCARKSLNFHRILDENNDTDKSSHISGVLFQHFWFRDDDLRDNVICKICWEKISEFHEFYLDVEKLHQRREPIPVPVIVKEEEQEFILEFVKTESFTEIKRESSPEEQVVTSADQQDSEQEEFSNEEVTHSEYEPKVVEEKPRATREYTKRTVTGRQKKSKNDKASYPYPSKTPQEREAEDIFIKQHTRYVCENCNVEFEHFHVFQRHCSQIHKKEGFITCCGVRYRMRSMLYQHVQFVMNPDAFKCEICEKTYKNRFGYNRHKKESHATELERAFQCHRCPKSFVRERALEKHLSDHETLDNGTAKCETCGKCFSNINVLKNHIKYRHIKQMQYICDVCSKQFYMRSMFMTHRKTHEVPAEELRKQCPVCSKWCKNHDYWRIHVRQHKNEGELSCEACGHISPNLVALRRHKARMHLGPRVFPCTLCGKEYSRASTLKEHVAAVHTRDGLCYCPHCEKPFSSSANMHTHRKKIHPKEWLEQRLARYANKDAVPDTTARSQNEAMFAE
ncbi:transcription factor grauzone-like [Toxorhynchites rutilus septentrionalis]|uniref:transcription factor grauzone-like n=1 Tax=Toxorhynchites rutilus septentrionalis TaxID=329112 RepID=UPI00247ABB67|nr:transcription factor grauzone-like [Toxorhynchites rutilus septentrionalis]